MKPYQDPNDDFNSPRFHSGKKCVERECSEPAGTGWSPYWCFKHNAARMDRIDVSLKAEMARRGWPIAEKEAS